MLMKRKVREICVITNKYPNEFEPNVLVFVQQLVWQFAKNGIQCTVICPMPVNIHPKYIKLNYFTNEQTDTGETIRVYRPKYVSLGQSEIIGINPARFSTWSFTQCVMNVLKKNSLKPDVLYSHFITPAGIATSRIGCIMNIPVFVAHGEATMMTIEDFGGPKKVAQELKTITGLVAVSAHNKKMLVDNSVVDEDKISIFPNGFNPIRFHKINQLEARNKMGFSQNDFIVGFVGSFDERKGILRLQEAVNRVTGVRFACAGKGKLIPNSENCIFKEPVKNENLVYFYNSCDIFVLPTRMEGCCNAIVEAVACGLPVISSDRLFNYDILDSSNAILVDPDDVDEIENALRRVYDNKKFRDELAAGSLKKAKLLTLEQRAHNILEFLENK